MTGRSGDVIWHADVTCNCAQVARAGAGGCWRRSSATTRSTTSGWRCTRCRRRAPTWPRASLTARSSCRAASRGEARRTATTAAPTHSGASSRSLTDSLVNTRRCKTDTFVCMAVFAGISTHSRTTGRWRTRRATCRGPKSDTRWSPTRAASWCSAVRLLVSTFVSGLCVRQ